MNDSIKGSLSVLLGAFLISFSPVFVGLVSLEPSVSAFYRVFFWIYSPYFYFSF